MNWFSPCLALLLLLSAAPGAGAQIIQARDDPPDFAINLDGPGVLDRGTTAGRIDVRAFGGREDLVYTSLGVRVGLGHDWEAAVRASIADRKSLLLPGGGSIRHGGSDAEVFARCRFFHGGLSTPEPSLTGLIGFALPNTPARTAAAMTVGLSAATPTGRLAVFTLNPRVAFLEHNTLFGLGLGVHLKLGSGISFIGDYTALVAGDNTRDSATGALMSRDVYGVAIRYSTRQLSLDLGFTNGAGGTTGFSLTPGLGGSGALYFSIAAHH